MDQTHLDPDEALASYIDSVTTLKYTRTIATVTPDIATRMLATIDLGRSRRLNGTNIDNLARAMRDGTFGTQANHADPLTFNPDGSLVNGRQRLVALILTGTTHIFALCLQQQHGVEDR